ncbi:hypothetical protein [Phenylobacterium sp.]|uniref:hypothetical protein n=1 Tax=Phenylobacterium sp. TaxID=1871053 RepID=UPI002BC69EE1|nr:hypothetical protein [Phenylobacterium sp.]HVI32853.1 hypothetical protein [Phenylobacterium sp.]
MSRSDTLIPPPWRLAGEACVSAWLARIADPPPPPPGWRLVRLGPFVAVGAVWARYGPGGMLAYDELAVGLVVRRGLSLGVTVPWIWVDSAVSRDGGQRLWAIPKQMARFHNGPGPAFEAVAETAAGEAGRVSLRPAGPRWPCPPLPFQVVQARAGRPVRAPARVRGRVQLGRAAWRLAPLPGLGRPLVSVRLTGMRLDLGPAA